MSPEYIRHIHRDETAERQSDREFQLEHKAPARFPHMTPEEYQEALDREDLDYVGYREAMEDEDRQDDYEQKVRETND